MLITLRWCSACASGFEAVNFSKPQSVLNEMAREFTEIFSNREPYETREYKFKYAEGVKEISPGLERSDYPGKSSHRINSFSAFVAPKSDEGGSDGEKVAGGRMRCPRFARGPG